MPFRTIARRVLAAVGLAPVAQVERLTERAALLEGQVAELRRAIQDARATGDRWKDEAQTAVRRAEALQDANRKLTKTEGEAADWKARDEKHLQQVHALKKQLDTRVSRAEQLVASARETLMATETKLDIVEAAINILDSRTRNDDRQ